MFDSFHTEQDTVLVLDEICCSWQHRACPWSAQLHWQPQILCKVRAGSTRRDALLRWVLPRTPREPCVCMENRSASLLQRETDLLASLDHTRCWSKGTFITVPSRLSLKRAPWWLRCLLAQPTVLICFVQLVLTRTVCAAQDGW